jgi:hypothetical protein
MLQDTSIRSYDNEIRPRLSERQATVRRLLLAYPSGLTNAEMAKLLSWPINTVTPRSNELVKLGVARDAGKRKCQVTGRTAHTWALTYRQPAPSKPASQAAML